jgi:hypothetical protein
MAYDITCRDCNKITHTTEIIDLIENHLDELGCLICSYCKNTNTYIYRESKLQEGENWKRYIRSAVTIDTVVPSYIPYIFLTSDEENGPITGIHFNYYKDTRGEPNGKLNHGHSPGGVPVLRKEELFQLLHQLVRVGIINHNDIEHLKVDTANG